MRTPYLLDKHTQRRGSVLAPRPLAASNVQTLPIISRNTLSEIALAIRVFIQATIPVLQANRQYACPHNTLCNLGGNHALPAEFKPCHTKTLNNRKVNAKLDRAASPPLPKLPTQTQFNLSADRRPNAYQPQGCWQPSAERASAESLNIFSAVLGAAKHRYSHWVCSAPAPETKQCASVIY